MSTIWHRRSFYAFIARLPSFRGDALLSTYLYRIIANVAQDEWKRRRRVDRPLVCAFRGGDGVGGSPPHPGLDAEQQLAEKQFRYSVEHQLQQLSPVERTVLVLYHQEECSYEQIAQSLKLPIGLCVLTCIADARNYAKGSRRQQAVERGPASGRRQDECSLRFDRQFPADDSLDRSILRVLGTAPEARVMPGWLRRQGRPATASAPCDPIPYAIRLPCGRGMPDCVACTDPRTGPAGNGHICILAFDRIDFLRTVCARGRLAGGAERRLYFR